MSICNQPSVCVRACACVSLNAGPAVGAHLQEAADSHAQPNATSITQQDVQNHLVPPALSEIRQQMHEEQLVETEESNHNECVVD